MDFVIYFSLRYPWPRQVLSPHHNSRTEIAYIRIVNLYQVFMLVFTFRQQGSCEWNKFINLSCEKLMLFFISHPWPWISLVPMVTPSIHKIYLLSSETLTHPKCKKQVSESMRFNTLLYYTTPCSRKKKPIQVTIMSWNGNVPFFLFFLKKMWKRLYMKQLEYPLLMWKGCSKQKSG